MSSTDIIKLHLDTMGFKQKPGAKKPGEPNSIPAIYARASRNIVSITKEQLVDYIFKGHSFIPGVCPLSKEELHNFSGASKQSNFTEQQIFGLDIDSDTERGRKEGNIKEFLSKLENLGIPPFLIYGTFSHMKKKHDSPARQRFRVLFATTKVVTDKITRDMLQATLMGLFKEYVDAACSNRNRYFNGTDGEDIDVKNDSFKDFDACIDADEVIRKYWMDEYVRFVPSDSPISAKSTKATKKTTKKDTKNATKKDTNKERKSVQQKTTSTTPRIKREYEFEDMGDEIPYTSYWKKNIRDLIDLLERIFEMRSWIEGEHRERFLHMYYHNAVLIYGYNEALERTDELRQAMKEPLTDAEFYYSITHANKDIDTYSSSGSLFPYLRDKISEELELTFKEIEESRIFKTREKNQSAEKNRPIKKERNEMILNLSKDKKLNAREITDIVNQTYPEVAISIRQVQKILAKSADFNTPELFPQTTIPNFLFSNFLFFLEGDDFNCLERNVETHEFCGPDYLKDYKFEGINMDVTNNTNNSALKDINGIQTKNTITLPNNKIISIEEYLNSNTSENTELSNQAILTQNKAIFYSMKYNTLLLGKGGCGKTYVLKQLIQKLENDSKKVKVIAPTSIASISLDGTTIHSAFGINPNSDDYIPVRWILQNLRDVDVLIIDEIGMVSKELFDNIILGINTIKEWYGKQIRLILSGDVLQLESTSGQYFFESEVFQSMQFKTIVFTENIRQSNQKYAELLNNIWIGKDIKNTVHILNAIYQQNEEFEDALYVYSTRRNVYKKNNEMLNKLDGELIKLDDVLSVKHGAKVVVTKNGNDYYNGMMGTFVGVDKYKRVIVELSDGAMIHVKKDTYITKDGSVGERYPLALGYALTVHKVQGMTLDKLNIHPSCFACGQLYVALSRVKSARGIHLLAPIKETDVIVNQKALDFYNDCIARMNHEQEEFDNQEELDEQDEDFEQMFLA